MPNDDIDLDFDGEEQWAEVAHLYRGTAAAELGRRMRGISLQVFGENYSESDPIDNGEFNDGEYYLLSCDDVPTTGFREYRDAWFMGGQSYLNDVRRFIEATWPCPVHDEGHLVTSWTEHLNDATEIRYDCGTFRTVPIEEVTARAEAQHATQVAEFFPGDRRPAGRWIRIPTGPTTPEQSFADDAGGGATLEDLGIHLEDRIDHAIDVIDETLADVNRETERPAV
jgi:hypothetical protein